MTAAGAARAAGQRGPCQPACESECREQRDYMIDLKQSS